MTTTFTPLKLVGELGWFEMKETERVRVERAILNGDTLLLDCEYERRSYPLKLIRTTGNNFEGGCAVRSGREDWTVTADCKLVIGGDEALIFGRWKEYGDSYYWWAVLEAVEHFDDEEKV